MSASFKDRAKQRQLAALKSCSVMTFTQLVVRLMPQVSLVDLIEAQPMNLPPATIFYPDVVELPSRERSIIRSAGTAIYSISPIRIATA